MNKVCSCHFDHYNSIPLRSPSTVDPNPIFIILAHHSPERDVLLILLDRFDDVSQDLKASIDLKRFLGLNSGRSRIFDPFRPRQIDEVDGPNQSLPSPGILRKAKSKYFRIRSKQKYRPASKRLEKSTHMRLDLNVTDEVGPRTSCVAFRCSAFPVVMRLLHQAADVLRTIHVLDCQIGDKDLWWEIKKISTDGSKKQNG